MKRIFKKILICILIFFILNNSFIGSLNINFNTSYAATYDENVNILSAFFSTVVGLLTWPFKLVAMGIALAVDKLMSAVAYIDGGRCKFRWNFFCNINTI